MNVIQICDHMIVEKENVTMQKTITVSGTSFDKITDEEIAFVQYIRAGDSTFFEDMHFMVSRKQYIEWICDPSWRPATSSQMDVYYEEAVSEIKSYTIDTCPRCGGSGWYAAAAGASVKELSVSTNEDKLIQDFIKILLTDFSKYAPGTSLTSLIGSSSRSEEEVMTMVRNAVKEAENQVRKNQYDLSVQGAELSDKEKLRQTNIEEIYVEGDAVYLFVTLISHSGFEASVGLRV